MNKKIIYAILLVLLIVLAGFLRETYFVRISWCQAVVSGKAIAPESHWLFSFLESFNLTQLTVAKFAGTCFFVLVFWMLSLLMVKLFFDEKRNYKLVHLLFAIPFAIACFIYTIGLLPLGIIHFYQVSRWIIGVIETPLVIMLLFPVLWVRSKVA